MKITLKKKLCYFINQLLNFSPFQRSESYYCKKDCAEMYRGRTACASGEDEFRD